MKSGLKLISVLLALAVAISISACGSTTEVTQSTSEAATETSAASEEVSGTVTALADGTITVETSSGESIDIPVNDATVYSFTMGEMPQGNGNMPSDDGNTPPEMPEGENNMNLGDGNTPPEMPQGDGNAPQGNGNTPPEMPQGDGNALQGDGSTPPDKPSDDGNAPQGNGDAPSGMPQGGGDMQPGDGNTPPDKPSDDGNAPHGNGDAPNDSDMPQGGSPEQASLDSIAVGSEITAVLGSDGIATEVKIVMTMQDGNGGPGGPGGNGGPGGMGNGNADISYTAVNTYDSDTTVSDETISSSGTDENAVLVNDGTVSLTDCQIARDSSDSTGGDNASSYGVGAALLTKGGILNVSDCEIKSNAKGGAGVFAYGDGIAYVSDTTISTSSDTAGGIHVAGGGTLYAWDLDVTTDGESSAAIRSDRGSGTMVVDGGTYTSNGTGSPAIYSTADITVNNATLTANGSEAICIEGKNTVRLFDCNLTGNMSDSEQNDCTWNIILYQSMSGDSEEGNSDFEMVGGTLTAKNGGMFYTTNTQSSIFLENVDITNAQNSEFFLRCTGNANARGWGKSGSNGADCTFTASEQTISGNVIWDSISDLDFYLTNESTIAGAFLQDESNAGNGGNGYAHLVVGEGCTWVVTANSTITSLENAGSIVDESGNAVSIVGSDGTIYVQGTSDFTVTVGSYSESADISNAVAVADSFSNYSVEKI